MRARDTRGTGVEIEAGIEAGALIGPADLLDPVAATDRPHAAADAIARFEHGDLVPGFLQLVGGDQAGDPGSENYHRPAVAAGSRKLEILGAGRRRDRQAERLHRQIGCAGAADRPHLLQQRPSCQCHATRPLPPRLGRREQQYGPIATKIRPSAASRAPLKRSWAEQF